MSLLGLFVQNARFPLTYPHSPVRKVHPRLTSPTILENVSTTVLAPPDPPATEGKEKSVPRWSWTHQLSIIVIGSAVVLAPPGKITQPTVELDLPDPPYIKWFFFVFFFLNVRWC